MNWIVPVVHGYIYNHNYEKNIIKLLKLQKWFKTYLLSKKISIMSELILPLYFHPEYKGGYFHKKQLLQWIDSLPK